MRRQAKKWRVYEESEKTRETTHWDLDYLPTVEIDALRQSTADRKRVSVLRRLLNRLSWR